MASQNSNESEIYLKDFFGHNSEFPQDGAVYSIVTSCGKPLFTVVTRTNNGINTYIPCITLVSGHDYRRFECPISFFMTSKYVDVNDNIVVCKGAIAAKPTLEEVKEFFTLHQHRKFRCETKSIIVGTRTHRWVRDIYKLNLVE